MKNTQVKCVGVTYNLEVPETAEEYDNIAGKQGACVESANKNVIYRQSNAKFRSEFCSLVEEDTGIERLTEVKGEKTVKDEDGNETTEEVVDFAETEKVYLDRVYAELGLETPEEIAARFGDLVEQAQATVKFDPSEREPSAPRSKKPRKQYRDTAAAIFEQAGQDGLDHVAGKLSDELGFEVEATEDGIALALQRRDEKRDIAAELLG